MLQPITINATVAVDNFHLFEEVVSTPDSPTQHYAERVPSYWVGEFVEYIHADVRFIGLAQAE